MNDEVQLRLLRKAFSDISRGYSVTFFEGKRLFIKHLSHHEQVDLDVLYKVFLDDAVKEGLPTQKYMLDHLKNEGVWTDKDDKEIESIRFLIERLVEGKKVIYLKSDLERQNEEIQKEELRYYHKKLQKEKLLGLTAETFAEKKVNEHYIVESFFLDNRCTDKYLTDEFFDNLPETGMQSIVKVYNKEMETVSDKNVKRLALQDFFQVYWGLSAENLYNFFGKPICDLTYFQIKLGSYGRTFRSVLEKADSYPDDIKSDPDKLLDYVRAGENAKQKMETAVTKDTGDNTVASTLFGAKDDDYKAVGMKSDGATTLAGQLKKKQAEGKKGLDMHDLMKMHGI